MNGKDIDAAYACYVDDPTPRNLDDVIRTIDPVCVYWAKRRYNLRRTTAIDRDDLMQEARLGVLQAIRSYTGASRFCTWATLWIRAKTIKYVEKTGGLITGRRSEYHRLVKRAYGKTRDTITAERPGLTRDELHTEIAARLGVSVGHIEAEYAERGGYQSLDAPYASDDVSRINMMQACDPPTDDAVAARIALQRVAARAELITNPYWRAFADNLLADQPETDTAMGKRFGTTRARAGQVKELVRDQLREALI